MGEHRPQGPGIEFEATVACYRDMLDLRPIADELPDIVFAYGDKKLSGDRVEHLSQAELWLDLRCQDVGEGAAHPASRGVVRRDGLEQQPSGFQGFWVTYPCSVIHLVCGAD